MLYRLFFNFVVFFSFCIVFVKAAVCDALALSADRNGVAYYDLRFNSDNLLLISDSDVLFQRSEIVNDSEIENLSEDIDSFTKDSDVDFVKSVDDLDHDSLHDQLQGDKRERSDNANGMEIDVGLKKKNNDKKKNFGESNKKIANNEQEGGREHHSEDSGANSSSGRNVVDFDFMSERVLAYLVSMEKRLNNVDDEILRLNRVIEELEDSIRLLQRSVVQQSQNYSSLGEKAEGSLLGTKGHDKNALDAEEEEYNNCVTLLGQGKLEDAESRFLSFIENNPTGKFVAQSNYWLGEIYYSIGNYKRASIFYLDSYKFEPNGIFAAESVFKLGMSFRGMQNNKSACQVFKSLLRDFSNLSSVIKKRTLIELKELRKIGMCD